MRAGLLNETLVFKEPKSETTETGFVRNEYVEVFRCKACRRKMALVVDKDGINAMEQFIGRTIVFQVRAYPVINDKQRVEYLGNTYEIKMINPQRDRTLLLTLSRMDT